MAQLAAFDISWMNPRSKTLLDQAHQLRCPHARLFLAHLNDKGHDLVGQLVGPLGGCQAGEPAFLKGGSA